MEATQARVVQFPQVINYAIPASQQHILNALVKHNQAVWEKMYSVNQKCGVDIDDIMPEERKELYGRACEAYKEIFFALEKLPDGEHLTDLFSNYVSAMDEYETHSSRRFYIKGIMDGAFSFKDVGETVLEEMSK